MHDTRKVVTQLLLPWWCPAGELEYSAMTLMDDVPVCRKKAVRLVRRWYRDTIGRTVHKSTLDRIWRRRLVQRTVTEQEMAERLHETAGRLHEEPNKDEGHNDSPGEAVT